MNDLPIQGEHHKFCFPAIRDVRVGDWGTNCFTCQVLSIVDYEGYIRGIADAEKRNTDSLNKAYRDGVSSGIKQGVARKGLADLSGIPVEDFR